MVSSFSLTIIRVTIREAKCSVDRLYDLVSEHYQAMATKVNTLESRELQRISQGPSLLDGITGRPEIAPNSHFERDLHTIQATALDEPGHGFWETLEGSRVYRKASANRMSAFSIDQFALTSSWLSGFSLDKVSNLSVINLAITEDEVYNPHRFWQTWPNRRMKPLPDLPPLPTRTATAVATLTNSNDKHKARQVEPKIQNIEPVENVVTALPLMSKALPGVNDPASSPVHASFPPNNAVDAIPNDLPIERDEAQFECKGCGEVSQLLGPR